MNRVGKYVLVTQNDVDRAERFLAGRGAWALPVARMLPFIRAFASIVAGIVDVPPVRFGVLNLIGTVVYIVALSSIGYSLGGEWVKFNKTFSDASYIVVGVILIAIVAFVLHRLHAFRKESAYAAKHGGTSQVGSDKQRSGRLYSHRARRGHARSHRHTGDDQRDLSPMGGGSPAAEVGQFEDRAVGESSRGDGRAGLPRSTRTATPTTSAPAACSASTAVSTDPPVVEVSSTASTRLPATSGPSIRRCRPWVFSVLRTTKASRGVPRLPAAAIIA